MLTTSRRWPRSTRSLPCLLSSSLRRASRWVWADIKWFNIFKNFCFALNDVLMSYVLNIFFKGCRIEGSQRREAEGAGGGAQEASQHPGRRLLVHVSRLNDAPSVAYETWKFRITWPLFSILSHDITLVNIIHVNLSRLYCSTTTNACLGMVESLGEAAAELEGL